MKTVAQQPLQNKQPLRRARRNCSSECEVVTRSRPAIRDPVKSYATPACLPVFPLPAEWADPTAVPDTYGETLPGQKSPGTLDPRNHSLSLSSPAVPLGLMLPVAPVAPGGPAGQPGMPGHRVPHFLAVFYPPTAVSVYTDWPDKQSQF
ncbi:hypothetical protein DPEC_G00085300 [Dallia pectoralis]|uniref:Uncharacterized protein n=1 Tax=Dallia pectoralis TaxID=75939 RepID=A0ACC2H080_DALPE|nr:hypothetical protein DPEC_G00085300 [Dallia pectoralis]